MITAWSNISTKLASCFTMLTSVGVYFTPRVRRKIYPQNGA